MNSRQRRHERRRFRHVATVDPRHIADHGTGIIYLMAEWCDARFGRTRYRYMFTTTGSDHHYNFGFTKDEDRMEFIMRWS